MSQQTQKSLILVDGSSFLFRAYHAIPPLTNPQGEPTNAIYGVSNMLRKLIADYQSEYITVVFDAPGKTFRNDLYDQYKAHRPPMPEDLLMFRLTKILGQQRGIASCTRRSLISRWLTWNFLRL